MHTGTLGVFSRVLSIIMSSHILTLLQVIHVSINEYNFNINSLSRLELQKRSRAVCRTRGLLPRNTADVTEKKVTTRNAKRRRSNSTASLIEPTFLVGSVSTLEK